jgi:hypothetical protein
MVRRHRAVFPGVDLIALSLVTGNKCPETPPDARLGPKTLFKLAGPIPGYQDKSVCDCAIWGLVLEARASMKSLRNRLIFFFLVAGFGLAAAPAKPLYYPAHQLLLVGGRAIIDETMLTALNSVESVFGSPEGVLFVVVPVGQPRLDRNGEITATSFLLGNGVEGDAAALAKVIAQAPLDLTQVKSVVLVSCFGGLRLADGSPSRAYLLAQELQVPVLATPGSIGSLAMTGRLTADNRVVMEPMLVTTRMPHGQRRGSDWVIEKPAQGPVESDAIASLERIRWQFDLDQNFVGQIMPTPGDLRVSKSRERQPNVVGFTMDASLQESVNRVWSEKYGFSLEERGLVAIVIDPRLVSTDAVLKRSITEALEQNGIESNGLILPLVRPEWFASGTPSFTQQLADAARQIIFYPTVLPAGGADVTQWQVARPRVTRMTYYENEIAEVRNILGTTLAAHSGVTALEAIFSGERPSLLRRCVWKLLKQMPWLSR